MYVIGLTLFVRYWFNPLCTLLVYPFLYFISLTLCVLYQWCRDNSCPINGVETIAVQSLQLNRYDTGTINLQ